MQCLDAPFITREERLVARRARGVFTRASRQSGGTHSSSHRWQMERVPFAAFSASNGPRETDVPLLVDHGGSCPMAGLAGPASVQIADRGVSPRGGYIAHREISRRSRRLRNRRNRRPQITAGSATRVPRSRPPMNYGRLIMRPPDVIIFPETRVLSRHLPCFVY